MGAPPTTRLARAHSHGGNRRLDPIGRRFQDRSRAPSVAAKPQLRGIKWRKPGPCLDNAPFGSNRYWRGEFFGEGIMRKIALALLIAFGVTIVAVSLAPSHFLVQTAVAGPKGDR